MRPSFATRNGPPNGRNATLQARDRGGFKPPVLGCFAFWRLGGSVKHRPLLLARSRDVSSPCRFEPNDLLWACERFRIGYQSIRVCAFQTKPAKAEAGYETVAERDRGRGVGRASFGVRGRAPGAGIIPAPLRCEAGWGRFTIDGATEIRACSEAALRPAQFLKDGLKERVGLDLKVAGSMPSSRPGGAPSRCRPSRSPRPTPKPMNLKSRAKPSWCGPVARPACSTASSRCFKWPMP